MPEIVWPPIPSAYAMGHLAMLMQLEQSQYWTADELAEAQFKQLAILVDHAYRTVPYYRDLFDNRGIDPVRIATPAEWSKLPLLSRRDLQVRGELLRSDALPASHGSINRTATGGSTNQPVVTLGTELTKFFWRVLTLRDHLWHRRDFRQSMASIRYTGDDSGLPPDGLQIANWGSATENIVPTGPGYLLNVRSNVDEQCEWLRRVNPGYLLGLPSLLVAIAHKVRQDGWHLANLKQLKTFGEVLESGSRSLLEQAFGVDIVDMYSSQEVGYIALQCPHNKHYHVQSENILVEILDDKGRPCGPGQVGRVVVSTLHNFAMPLLRYDIGDYGEVGETCSCGRGLPVLRRILGRQRNLLVMPDGSRRWPLFNLGERPDELPPFFQFQVVQRSRDEIEVLVVRHEDFASDEITRVQVYMQQTLGHPFAVDVRRVAEIPRSPTGKHEDFVSFVDAPN